jgi:hypothetical protein
MHLAGLFARGYYRYFTATLLFFSMALLCACETLNPAPAPAPAVSKTKKAPVVNEQQVAEIRALKNLNAELQLKLLERNAELTRLERERSEAIQEVVRTKSKLRGMESKAEAASTMAEVEIALRQVKAAAVRAAQDPGPGIREADRLMKMSAAEFENSNYGGTIYLATQAKSLIGTRRDQMGTKGSSPQPDEVSFAFPIALESLGNSNVRDGPGIRFGILLTVSNGEPVLGLAYKDQWVRVRVQDGREGWVHYTLVDNHQGQPR